MYAEYVAAEVSRAGHIRAEHNISTGHQNNGRISTVVPVL